MEHTRNQTCQDMWFDAGLFLMEISFKDNLVNAWYFDVGSLKFAYFAAVLSAREDKSRQLMHARQIGDRGRLVVKPGGRRVARTGCAQQLLHPNPRH
jgi:hypothetical protein